MRLRFATFALTLLLPLPALAAPAKNSLEIINTLPRSIVTVAIARANTSAWQAIPLGGKTIPGGGSITLGVVTDDSCLRDVRVTLADDRVLVHRNIDVCRFHSYRTGVDLPNIVVTTHGMNR